MQKVVLMVVSLFWLSALQGQEVNAMKTSPVVKLLTLGYGPVNEMSGLVKSKRYEDVYWMQNDSGDSARVFAVNHEGKIIFPAFLGGSFYGEEPAPGKTQWAGLPIHGASNIDWEDIAVDGDYLYIADMGNNGNARRDMGVYVLAEPNPRQVEAARILKFIPIRYPEQNSFPASVWHFDSEALFISDGKLYFLTKHRQPGKIADWEPGSVLYRLDTQAIDQINVLTRVDEHPTLSVVTGADLSPDGQYLAVLGYLQLWIFKKPAIGDAWLSRPIRMMPLALSQTKQAEAIAWDDSDTILIGNEEAEWFRAKVSEIPSYPPEE